MMSNCWVQSMLAGRYGFSPNCNEDGTFGPKQCFLQRYILGGGLLEQLVNLVV